MDRRRRRRRHIPSSPVRRSPPSRFPESDIVTVLRGLWGAGFPGVNWRYSRQSAWPMFGAMTVPRSELLSALNWLVEAGADEAVRDTPTNRFVAVPGRNSPLKSGPDPAPIRRPETPAATTAVAPSDAI